MGINVQILPTVNDHTATSVESHGQALGCSATERGCVLLGSEEGRQDDQSGAGGREGGSDPCLRLGRHPGSQFPQLRSYPCRVRQRGGARSESQVLDQKGGQLQPDAEPGGNCYEEQGKERLLRLAPEVDASTGTATSGTVTIRQDNGSETTFHAPAGDQPSGTYMAPPRILASNNDGTWTYMVRQSARYTFSATGKLTSIKDLNNETATLA
jgi:hypothetical protein